MSYEQVQGPGPIKKKGHCAPQVTFTFKTEARSLVAKDLNTHSSNK